MAKPNYSFEKRQRELAKKKKKEEKQARKTSPDASDGTAQHGGEQSAQAPTPVIPAEAPSDAPRTA